MKSHKELLKCISDFLVKYLPEQTKAVLDYTKQKSRDMLIKLIPALRAFGLVDSIDKNYSVYWIIDLSNVLLVKEVLVSRLKELCN